MKMTINCIIKDSSPIRCAGVTQDIRFYILMRPAHRPTGQSTVQPPGPNNSQRFLKIFSNYDGKSTVIYIYFEAKI